MSRQKYSTNIDVDVLTALRRVSDNRNVPQNRIIEQAITEYLNPEDYKTTSLEYLQRIDTKYSTVLHRLDLLLEVVGTFIRLWFRAHPSPPTDEDKERLAQQGEQRYEKFKQIIQSLIEGGLNFRRSFDAEAFDVDDFYEG